MSFGIPPNVINLSFSTIEMIKYQLLVKGHPASFKFLKYRL